MQLILRRNELNILHLVHLLGLCCDNCIRKQNHTHCFESIYDLIAFIDTSYGREPISHLVDKDDSDLGSITSPKTWGNLRAGNHLAIRRRVLEAWRYDCWQRNYRFCSWGVAGVMSDLVLSKLASSCKIETIEDMLEAVSDWGYASKYCHEVLSLLEDADREHQLESQAQRTKTRLLNKKRKIGDLERDVERQDQPACPVSSPVLLHTRIIEPIVVKHVENPTRPHHPRPRPRPTPVSCPYTDSEFFESLMNNSRSMLKFTLGTQTWCVIAREFPYEN